MKEIKVANASGYTVYEDHFEIIAKKIVKINKHGKRKGEVKLPLQVIRRK